MKLFSAIEKTFVKIVEMFLLLDLAAMILLVAAQVIVRFIGRNAMDMSWSEEATRYLLCYMVFFSTVLLYENHGHVWVANLVDAVPSIPRKIMLTASYLIQALFFVAIFHGAVTFFPTVATQYSNVLHIPLPIVYCGIPITAGLSLVFCARDMILMLAGKGDMQNG